MTTEFVEPQSGRPWLSAEQLAVALMTMARRLFEMGGTLGADEHGFRNMGDQLAGWASDVRQLNLKLHESMVNVEKIRELCRDNEGLSLAREILEVIDG